MMKNSKLLPVVTLLLSLMLTQVGRAEGWLPSWLGGESTPSKPVVKQKTAPTASKGASKSWLTNVKNNLIPSKKTKSSSKSSAKANQKKKESGISSWLKPKEAGPPRTTEQWMGLPQVKLDDK